MPRNRMIKPEFWDDEKLAKISRDARLTFIGMWNHSDDYGVVKGSPIWLKNQIYPYDNKLKIEKFEEWLAEIIEINAIIPFPDGCEDYFFIKNFLKHQTINRPSQQRNPAPPDTILEDSMNTQGALIDEVKLKEVKLKEDKEKETRACAWPDDFILTDKMIEYAIKNNIDPKKVELFFEDFHNWANQNEKKYKNWEAAYRNRVLKAPEYGKQFMAEKTEGDRQRVFRNLRRKYESPGKVAQKRTE